MEILELLKKDLDLTEIDILENVNLEKYTTIKLGRVGHLLIVKSTNSLSFLVKYLSAKKMKYHLIGWGSNQVIVNTADCLFIKLEFQFDRAYLKSPKKEYTLPASIAINALTSHATKFGVLGWEVFTGVPASLGGAIAMNAGTSLGEICELVKDIQIMDFNGEIRNYLPSENSFSYRKNHFLKSGDIIVSATLISKGFDEYQGQKIKDYLEYRKSTQPLTTKNCGSVFKNPKNDLKAGIAIDTVGLKEFGFEKLKVTRKHGNFIENSGNQDSTDFIVLTETLIEELERYTGVKFELEVKIY